MWMVGYTEGGDFNMVDHSFNARKLRPLMPRPMTSLNNAPTTTTANPTLALIHGNDLFPQYHYHHLGIVGEQNKREELNGGTQVVVSSRWNPTAEQLRALEELYRRGTRTPSAEQIQHITAQLRTFGKIEGKNVFYWFQNHKARERQKRRRQMELNAQTHQENKDLAATRTAFEQTKNWALSTNCSALAEESVSTQRAAKAVGAECRTDGWLQFEEGELQQRRNFLERNATWHVMQLPCPSSAPLINTPPSTTTTTTSTSPPTTAFHPHYNLSFFFSPQRENGLNNNNNNNDLIHLSSNSSTSCEDDHCVESQTLQLFPLRSAGDDDNNINHKEETHISASAMNANFTPSQFFEFLPLKN